MSRMRWAVVGCEMLAQGVWQFLDRSDPQGETGKLTESRPVPWRDAMRLPGCARRPRADPPRVACMVEAGTTAGGIAGGGESQSAANQDRPYAAASRGDRRENVGELRHAAQFRRGHPS